MDINYNDLGEWIHKEFDEKALPSLIDFIKIPNQSPLFDPEWDSNGYDQQAAKHVLDWTEAQGVTGLTAEVQKDEGKTSLLYVEVESTYEDKSQAPTLFFYGHFDKQPPFVGWKEGYGPTIPVLEDGKLYGRGPADDGYSIYTAILAIKAC